MSTKLVVSAAALFTLIAFGNCAYFSSTEDLTAYKVRTLRVDLKQATIAPAQVSSKPSAVQTPPSKKEATLANAIPVSQMQLWKWEDPAETRARMWAVPKKDQENTTATTLLRMCGTEVSWKNEIDCRGIWHVITTIRSKNCDRSAIGGRRITECDEGGETYLSAMRRLAPRLLGTVKAPNGSRHWMKNVNLDCAVPKGWGGTSRRWEAQYGMRCREYSSLVTKLVSGQEIGRLPTRARPIAWGGRCETEDGACDDPIACSRGLHRIRNLGTENAFWCRPGTRGCAPTIDPICAKFGYDVPGQT